MTIPRLDLVLKAQRSELPMLLTHVSRFAAENGIPPDAAFKMELAVDELANNVIDHGYPTGKAGEICISLAHHGSRVTIDFFDDACLFDPLGVPEPDMSSDIEARSPRGLGIHLVRSLMTESRYSVEGRHNRISLGLALDPRPDDPS